MKKVKNNNNLIIKKNMIKNKRDKKTSIKIDKNKSKKNKYKLEKEHDEVEIYYQLRNLFIDKMKPKKMNKKEFNLLKMYSNILINMIFLKCRYRDETEEIIKKFFSKNINNIKKIINKNIIF